MSRISWFVTAVSVAAHGVCAAGIPCSSKDMGVYQLESPAGALYGVHVQRSALAAATDQLLERV